MKIQKMISRFACAVMAFATPLFVLADPNTGDLRSITVDNTAEHAYPNEDSPLRAGETVTIRFKLMNRNTIATQTSGTLNPWILRTATGADPAELAQYPLEIGVWVGGRRKWAKITDVVQNGQYWTDVVAEYVVEAGDIALPVLLSNTAGTGSAASVPTGGETTIGYSLRNANLWKIVSKNAQDVEANFWFGPATPSPTDKDASGFPYSSEAVDSEVTSTEKRDYDLSNGGVYAQAIDFDSDYADPDTSDPRAWRYIYKDMTSCLDQSFPSVSIPGGAGSDTVVYIWSDNSDVAVLSGNPGTTKNYTNLKPDGVTPYTTKVWTCTIPKGSSTVPFKVLATGNVGEHADIYLASTPTNIFDKAGNLLVNFVKRTVFVTNPPAPFVTAGFGSSPDAAADAVIVQADASYKVAKTTMWVTLSEAYTTPVTVDVTASYSNGNGALDLSADENIVVSKSATGAGWNTRTTTVTIPAGSKSAAFYVYVRGATSNTADGIVFNAKISGDGDYYDDTAASAELTVQQGAPIIEAPVDGTKYEGAQTGIDFYLEDFKILDNYANMKSATGYTVYYRRAYETGGGDTKFQKLAEGYKVSVATGLADSEAGMLKIKLAKAGKATVRVYVVAPDGSKSAERSFSVDVAESPMVSAEVTRGLNDDATANEGDTLQVKFYLTSPNDTGSTLYAYLVPSDQETADIIGTMTARAAKGSSGVPIAINATNSVGYAQLKFADGTAMGTLASFTVLLSTESKLTADPDYTTYPDTGYEAVDAFASNSLQIFVVNVEPSVGYVQMNGVTAVSKSGEDCTVTTSQGLKCKFAVYVNEPSSIDLNGAIVGSDDNRFYVQYTFYDGNAAPQVKIVPGNPNALSGGIMSSIQEFTFQSAGRNKVVVALKDKDMDAYTDSDHSFTFYVNVNATPGVTITSPYGTSSYDETSVGPENGVITVNLTAACDRELEVGLRVDYANPADSGKFILPTLTTNGGERDVDADGDGISEHYYVMTFRANYLTPGADAYINFMDGTTLSRLNGVKITPVILTEGTSTYGNTYKELYSFLNTYTIYPVNVAPEFVDPSEYAEAVTNKAVVGVTYTRNWAVSDIANDFAGTAASVTVNYEGNNKKLAEGQDGDGSAIANGGTFSFEFKSSGTKIVVLTVTDKDGASSTRQIIYEIDPSKNVNVYPHGSNMSALSDVSKFYVGAIGLGTGKIWRDGDEANKYSDRKTYAFDQAAATATFLAQGDINVPGALDSFLYGWILDTMDENGAFTGVLTGVNPVLGKSADPKNYERPVALPGGDDFDEDANAYPDRYLEAIFAREYLDSDNMGDINQDGIPDYFAVARMYENGVLAGGEGGENGGGNGSDLVKLTKFNDDEDYLPAPSTQDAGVIIPNIVSGWATTGKAFDAYMEIRGFGDGLNFVLNGKLISEVDFTDAEKAAYCAWKGIDVADFEANIEEVKADLVKGNNAGGWSPENPTDPTSDDTDGDGIPDGYEYFFWYAAKVGSVNGDGTYVPFVGKRMSFNDLENFEDISAEDIMKAFDPNKATTEMDKRDTDNDGLTDLEEFAMGTNPISCDTDGDGLPDGWEVMWGLNPLVKDTDKANGGDTNPDKDYMAQASTEDDYFIVTMADGSKLAVLDDGTVDPTAFSGDVPAFAAIPVAEFNGGYTPAKRDVDFEFFPGKKEVAIALGKLEFINRFGEAAFDEIDDGTIADDPDPAAPTVTVASCSAESAPLGLYHAQVFAAFGFDPRTGWYSNPADASLAPRWKDNGSVLLAGTSQNTVPFSNKDEYLVAKYRYIVGINDFAADAAAVASKQETILSILAKRSTNPNIEFTETSWGDSTLSFASEQHGADSDADGIADGWELYVGNDPCDPQDANKDLDFTYAGDGLSVLQEFAGTDVIAAYSGCQTIVDACTAALLDEEKRPWINKFFPTNPHSGDTDGDGIGDADEGAPWAATFVLNRFGQGTKSSIFLRKGEGYTFLYGNPVDDGESRCIRGGGMNPCSIDTDMDGLPDAWERQYAGIPLGIDGQPVSAKLKTFLEGCNDLSEAWLSDGVYTNIMNNGTIFAGGAPSQDSASTNGLAQAYISMGMDATFSDAYSDDDVDPMLGTIRDFDWDHDGLQNWQEYLVQTIRCFRYDDVKTPLMGHDVPLFDDTSMTYNADWAAYIQYIRMNTVDPTMMKLDSFPNVIAKGDLDYKALGYFSELTTKWDPNYISPMMPVYYLFPPTAEVNIITEVGITENIAASGFVGTDPRQWDTDEDNMDDYWELFHGLNPLLGSDTPGECDVIASAYANSDVFNAMCNPWTGNDLMQSPIYDAMKYPWMMGSPMADADGDGIRNAEEAIAANLDAPNTYHTDPTPAWMTDSTVTFYSPSDDPDKASFVDGPSLVSQYYSQYMDRWPLFSHDRYGASDGQSAAWIYAFEENEGFDTDHDWKGDAVELVTKVQGASDPINVRDPARRQAMWFGGEADPGAVISYLPVERPVLNENANLLRNFTVEAWVKPESFSDGDQFLVTRSCSYKESTLTNKFSAIRMNFAIGIDAEKRPFAMFQSNDAGTDADSTQRIVARNAIEVGKWVHFATTYNGKEFVLYINGVRVAGAQSTIIPANGITRLLQDPQPNVSGFPVLCYAMRPSVFMLGARPAGSAAFYPLSAASWASAADSFFNGWIGEVRVWDGVRTSTEILADYKVSYTDEQIAALREEQYQVYLNRNNFTNNAYIGATKAELLQCYNFGNIPGAVNKADVIKEPVGFKKAVLDNVRENDAAIDDKLAIGWWSTLLSTPIASTVYTSKSVVPWVANAVAHLPYLSGIVADSRFWSETLAGYTHAKYQALKKFDFSNTANPYSAYIYDLDRFYTLTKLEALNSVDTELYGDMFNRYIWDLRCGSIGSSDLIPLGSAFPRRDADFWDGIGSMDAWTDTGTDTDEDGIPDWYVTWATTEYGLTAPVTADTMVERDGLSMPLYKAYLIDLGKEGLLPSGIVNAAYAEVIRNNLPKWWVTYWGFSSLDPMADEDADGLSNYAEYLVGEVFGFAVLDPSDATTDGTTLDYFRKIGSLYLGEMFSDHDQIADSWEDRWNIAVASRWEYDANRDYDDDGWSNYAEACAGTSPMLVGELSVDSAVLPAHPVPALTVKLVPEDGSALDAAIIVQGYKGNITTRAPDAVWKIAGTSNVLEKAKVIGMNPKREMVLRLGPGSIQAGSVKIEMKDPSFVVYKLLTLGLNTYLGGGIEGSLESAEWVSCAIDKPITDGNATGDILMELTQKKIGTINYMTGEVTIDFGAMSTEFYIDGDMLSGNNSSQGSAPSDAKISYVTLYHPLESYIRMTWGSGVIMGSSETTIYLSDADEGYLREGKNSFVAFVDSDGNGEYTPGELFGVANGVDVGWNAASLEIGLTRANRILPRILYPTLESDAKTIYGENSPLLYKYVEATTPFDPTAEKNRVRIVRSIVHTTAGSKVLPAAIQKVVLDTYIDNKTREYLHEGDFFSDTVYDIDWESLATDLAKNSYSGVTGVTYRVVCGEAPIFAATSQTLGGAGIAFTRSFDLPAIRIVPEAVSPGSTKSIIYGAKPTFIWSPVRNGNAVENNYTAFRIIVKQGAKAVWDSGLQHLPRLRADGTYVWEAPLFVGDQTAKGEMIENWKNYEWSVSMYNAMHKTDSYSASKKFEWNVNGTRDVNDNGYSAIKVAVKYNGPLEVLSSMTDNTKTTGKVRVEAYATPDFSGDPVARTIITDINALTNVNSTVTAKLIGIPAGSYYVRAFVDTDGDFEKDDWESWGLYCIRGDRNVNPMALMDPVAVRVGPELIDVPEITVWIEDADTDGDALPDAWEMVKNGSLSAVGPVQAADGWISVNPALVTTLSAHTLVGSPLSAQSTQLLTSLANPDMAALLMGVNTLNYSSSYAAISAAASPEVEENGVKITGVNVVDGVLTIDYSVETTSSLDAPAASLYVLKTDVSLAFSVDYAATLGAEFKSIYNDTFKVTVGENTGSATFTLKDALEAAGIDANSDSGFFKLRVDVVK